MVIVKVNKKNKEIAFKIFKIGCLQTLKTYKNNLYFRPKKKRK